MSEFEKIKKNNENLLPCPFCGGKAEILPQEPYVKTLKHFMIRCVICGANRSCFTNHFSQVVAEWNVRVKPKEE